MSRYFYWVNITFRVNNLCINNVKDCLLYVDWSLQIGYQPKLICLNDEYVSSAAHLKKKLSQVQGISRMLCYSFTDDGFYLFLSCPMTNRFWHTTYDLNILTILTIISSLARCYEGKRYNILFISLAAHSNLVYLEYEQQICVLGFSFQFY